MQSKILYGIFGLLWSGICYEGGRISQKQKKYNYSSTIVEIEHPQLKGIPNVSDVAKSLTQVKAQNDTFIDGIIQPPYRFVNYPYFKILYSTYHKCPLAVHQKVTKQLADGDAPRRSTFFNQKSIQENFQSTNDHFIKTGAYKNFSFARGHMAAAGNYSGNKAAKWMTFTYANVVPQHQYNNGGIWNTFERYSRDLVMDQKCDSVQVISGPIYYKNGNYEGKNGQKFDNVYKEQSLVLLENGMVVPQKLYKIIKCNTKTGEQYIDAFEFWNKKTFDNQKPLKVFKTTLQSVQNQTGLKFNFAKDVVGKPAPLKSLVQFDREGFETTKTVYDTKFYINLMRKSKTIQEMDNSFMRARQQHIYIPLNQFGDQSQKLFKQDIKQIQKNYESNKNRVSCQVLNNLIKLNKNLYYLKQLKQQQKEQIRRIEQLGPITIKECLQKAHVLRGKKWDDIEDEVEKKQKSSLNSLTYAITRQINRNQEQLKIKGAPVQQIQARQLKLVNQDKLKQFIIQVNIATQLSQQAKKVQQ